ncbi:hypothetical protein MTP04_07160 [Lysinibacillus sp. PLM2]|nr:hypothetical protein MTP04_07160 [Lysinibacillus sp. PLM2]
MKEIVKLQYITRIILAFMIFMLISSIPVETYAVTEGTDDGTYDFGGLDDDDSAGAGFAKLGDKFHISNGFDPDGTRIYAYGDNLYVPDGTTTFVIKAEGGNVCNTFTFEDLGISGVNGTEILDNFKLEVKDKDGNETTVVNVVDANKKLNPSTQQISALFDQTINYPNVVEIKITYKTELGNDLSYVNFDNITIADVSDGNEPPTDIALSNSSFPEDAAPKTTIGTLSATDPDEGDTHIYSLVSGDTDYFLIEGNQLKTTDDVFDYETKNSYSITVGATDAGGLTKDQTFSISVTNVNETPTVLELKSNTVLEKEPLGTTIGTLNAIDPDEGDMLTYSLVSGDTDYFLIEGNQLITNAEFDYETKNSYSITVRATDADGLYVEKVFTITVTKNQTPTGSILINSGDTHTNSTNLTLTLTGNDPEGKIIQMRFSQDEATWSSWEAFNTSKSYMLSADDGTKTVYMQLQDEAGNIVSYSDTIELDTTPPVVSGVENNGVYNSSKTITFNEGTATLNGDPFESGETVDTIDEEDFTLVVTDLADNLTTVNFIIDKVAPTSNVTISSDNSDETRAKIGDTITLDILTSEYAYQIDVTIAGKPVTVTDKDDSDVTTWQATYVMTSEDEEGKVPFTVSFQDQAGNPSEIITDESSNSLVYFDKTVPTATVVMMTSSNSNTEIAIEGDTITLDIETSEDVQQPIVTIAGEVATVTDKGDGNDKTWQAAYTLQTGDSEGAISFTIDFQDMTGNTATQVTAVTSGNVVVFDETAPILPTVTITSNNTNPTLAKVGDIITLNIEASEDIQTPTVTIAGKSATVTDNDDSNAKTWEATYQMEASDAEGLVAFTIDYKDLVNNSGTQVTSVTTGTDVTFDKTAPTASTVTIESNNTDPTKAKIGDTVTLTFTTSEDVGQPDVTISGKAATVSDLGDSNATTWQATYVMDNEDVDGTIIFAINFNDLAGNAVPEVTATTNASTVTFDGIVPTAPTIIMTSDNTDPKTAKVGDTITLDIETSEDVQQPIVTIAGEVATVTDKGDGNDKTWQAAYTLQTGDPEGAISFTLEIQDLAGNIATPVTTVTSGNVVVFDETAPTLPTVTITSNNTNTTKAKVGDIITLNIEASEDIQTPTVTIAGKSATVTDNDDSNAKTWEATYQMEASDAEGLVAFTIDYKDLVNNSGTQVTSVTTGTDVTFDKTAPTASTVTIKSSNTDPTKAKVGDTITLDFTTSEDVGQPVVTIAGKTVTVKTNGNSTTWIAEYTIKSNDPNGLTKFSIDFQDLSGNNGTQVTKTTDSSLVTVQVNNSNTGGSGGGGNNGKTRTVNVLIGEGNLSIAQVEITRETKENGKQVDVVNFNEEKANFVVNAALQQSQKFIRIMIDDLPNNPADEVSVTVPLKSINSLVKGNMSLEIMTNDVKVTIPLETLIRLQQQGIDLYYNIKPIHNEKERTEVEDRTINADEVKKFAGNNAVIVHGKSVQIETNYKKHPTNVAFPLNGIKLPTDPKERKVFLDSLAVYIEHSDGEKKVQKGTIIYDSNGNPVEISFSVNKFSTFTIISVLDASTNHSFSDIQSDHWAKEMIQALVEKNIIKGYSDGTFRPNEPITRQHVAVILARTLEFEPQKEMVPFKDVPKNHMYYEEITLMQQAGIFEGSEGMFNPDTNITRAQMAIVLTNAFKLDSVKTTNTVKFKDVDPSHWAYNDITTLANIGISHGDNGYFKPNDSLTRAQFVAFLYRALDK